MMKHVESRVCIVAAMVLCAPAHGGSTDDAKNIAQLDTKYQAAVKANDAPAMAAILHENMLLVLGNGTTNTRAQLLLEARNKAYIYERQEEDPGTQTVRVWGDTAVVSARLWVKGVNGDAHFDRHLWFSDTYVRTPKGWRYFYGQASLHLP